MSEFRIQPAYGQHFDAMDAARAANEASSLCVRTTLAPDGSILVQHSGAADASWQIRSRLAQTFGSVEESQSRSSYSSSAFIPSTSTHTTHVSHASSLRKKIQELRKSPGPRPHKKISTESHQEVQMKNIILQMCVATLRARSKKPIVSPNIKAESPKAMFKKKVKKRGIVEH